VQNDAYSFDAIGNLSSRSQYFGSTSLTEAMVFDALNRLTSATPLGGAVKTVNYNDIRPFVTGRKNWLFADTPKGASASAVIYSLVETAKANGHEPYAYLRHVLTALPKARSVEDVEQLLPWHLNAAELMENALR
jgi:hypothetical protein